MCLSPPKPPPLPEPEPVDSAIEQTAETVVVGDQRTQEAERRRRRGSGTTLQRLGTRSLQIPLLTNSTQQGSNLNYPV